MQQLFKTSNHYHYKPSKNCSFKNNQFLHRTTRTRNFNIKLCMYNLIVVTGNTFTNTGTLWTEQYYCVHAVSRNHHKLVPTTENKKCATHQSTCTYKQKKNLGTMQAV